MKFYLPVSEVVISDLKLKKNKIKDFNQETTEKWNIQIKNLSYSYPKSKKKGF